MKKTNKPCLSDEESKFIDNNRHRMCIIEMSKASGISIWKIRNYLYYHNLSVLSGRGREFNQSHEEGDYFNVDAFKGDTACLAYKNY